MKAHFRTVTLSSEICEVFGEPDSNHGLTTAS